MYNENDSYENKELSDKDLESVTAGKQQVNNFQKKKTSGSSAPRQTYGTAAASSGAKGC